MELYGQKSKSIPQKIVIHLFELFFIWLSYWILFQNGGNLIQQKFNIHNAVEANERREIIFAFSIIAFLRLGFMMFYLLKRKIPWEESISIPFAFALYYVGFSLFVLPTNTPIDFIDYFAIGLFISGSFINTFSEILRDRWKCNDSNKGKLYTLGLFKYSRHINYFGDILWISAYAIITRNLFSITVPLFLFSFFAFYNIPMLDKYLYKKYGEEFNEYAKQTKRLIPFVY